MASPSSPAGHVRFRAEHAGQEIVVWIERASLERLEPVATEMYFVIDEDRRYKLCFDGVVGGAL